MIRVPWRHGEPRRRVLGALCVLAALAASVAGGQEPTAAEPPAPGAETSAAEGSPTAAALEIAAAEAALERLAALERAWRAGAEAEERAVAGSLEEVAELEARLAEIEPGDKAADALFDRSKEILRDALAGLEAALDRAVAPSEVPRPAALSRRRSEAAARFSASGRSSSVGGPTSAEAERLEELEGLLEERTRELEALELRLREGSIDRHGAYAGRLWELRPAAVEALPAERRRRIRSLTRERWAELALDLEVLRVASRIQRVRTRNLLARAPQLARDVFAATELGGALARLALVVLLWRWVQRRRRRTLERLAAKSAGLDDPQHSRARLALELAGGITPWGIFLLALAGLRWALGPEIRDLPFVGPLLIVAAIYGGYRLGADLLVAALAAGARHAAIEMSAERRARLVNAVRRFLRVLTVVAAVLALYAYRLGNGLLYTALRNAGLWVMALTLLVVLAPWRRELADACLAMRSTGRWASFVRRTRDRWTGVLAAPLYFLWLGARVFGALGHELASGHEGARLATAFLARRRIEKEARERGYAEADLERLPAELAGALDETVRAGDLEILDPVPGLDEAGRAVAAWRRGFGGGLLLAGELGMGKRAWIDRFAAGEPAAVRLTLDRRLLEPAELRAWLGSGLLNGEAGDASRDDLAARLLAGEPRIVVLENAENLFLTRVNGYRALGELAALAGETRRGVFWLLSMGGLAWNNLQATWKETAFMSHAVALPAWSREQILELLRRRLDAGGFSASFADLLGGSGEDAAVRGREAEQAYSSLLWDFAGGNPRVALHYFLRSLVPASDGQVRVRAFRPPPEDALIELGDDALFLLAAVGRHAALTPAEAAAATAYPEAHAWLLLGRLLDLGAIEEVSGRLRLTTHWQSTVLRLLRRRNVLVS